jgi:hypothetical protein
VIVLDFGGIDLTAGQIADMRTAARDAAINAARAFGFGPEYWLVERPSGGGPGAREPVVLPDMVHALAYRQRPSQLAAALAGQPVGDEIWRVIILDIEADVQVDDALVPPSGGQAIHIDSLEQWYDYRRGEVSEARYGDQD